MDELVLTSKEAWSKRRICSEKITMIQQFYYLSGLDSCTYAHITD